ncbi:MAG TPA: selenocysteine-specific translation elongation factor [Candidatus Blautia faecipullorum]|nr:selenocysteine-specific translation elongation factor [Candidatus Blautia faecipullorum]
MRYGIIGTAGHVDHGKTCLIQALTGIDTDRLKEEKKRGITIELGFAWLELPEGGRVGIVDVPGHEKFVKNMLAGAGGMDLVMLVVAADEGVMPQTVEHLDILSILGIRRGVIVITKTDLADPDLVDLVEEDIRELVKGTFLEDAPAVPVSVYENRGLDRLKEVLYEMYRKLPDRKEGTCFRLPIDRVFTMKGFGTVVTGTLSEGKIRRDQEVVLYPENRPVKIRSIQVHGQTEETAYSGQRVAVNIPDRTREEVFRGDVLATKNSLYPTRMADVILTVLRHTDRTVKNGSRVHIYHGTRELLGKAVLLDREELKAGESCYAQLRLEEETVLRKGDRFVIRFYSPAETIGGGEVLDACPRKHRRRDEKVLEAFRVKEKGTAEELLELSALEHWGCFCTLEELAARSSLNRSSLKNTAVKLAEKKRLVPLEENLYIHRDEFDYYRRKTEKFLDEFHRAYPLKEGMGAQEARSRLGLSDSRRTDEIFSVLKDEKVIKEANGFLSKKRFRVVLKEDEDAIVQEIIRHYLEAGFAPLATELYTKEHRNQKKFQAVFTSLLNKKVLIRLDGQYCVHREYYEKAKKAFAEMASRCPEVVLGEYRDYLGCSRKVAVALLEHFDKNGYTRKTEGGRVLKNPVP